MTGRLSALGAALAATLLFAASASADTVQVTVNTDSEGSGCELREAFLAFTTGTPGAGCTKVAAPGTDQITFAGALTGATIDLVADPLDTDGALPLNVIGPGMNSLTVSAATGERVLDNDGSTTLGVSGMTLRDGAPNGMNFVQGGCVENDGTMTLTDVRVTNCEAILNDGDPNITANGGGIANNGNLTLNSSLVELNEARAANSAPGGNAIARGAGIHSAVGTLTINDSTIRGNEAAASSEGDTGTATAQGGVFIDSVPTATISQSTISANTAEGDAGLGSSVTVGGISTSATAAVVEQSTIAGNTADADGAVLALQAGGIYSNGNATSIRSSTIALNGPPSATSDGANLHLDNGTTTVTNSILADPRGGGDNCRISGGTLATGGFNDDYSDPAGPSCFAVPLATDTDDDPLLAPAGLAGNGGPTQTIALQPTSPMIDAGSNVGNTDLTTDQRGLLRPVDFPGLANAPGSNGTDIGALEVQQACAGQATPSTVCPDPPPVNPSGPTGKRAKALKKCKKIKKKKARNKCIKKAKKLPV